MKSFDARSLARALDGDVTGPDSIICPGPGHSRADHSLSIRIVPGSKDGYIVHSFAGDDPIRCKDYVRERLGLDRWRPGQSYALKRRIKVHAPSPDQHAKHLGFARSIWEATRPARGTLVEKYLLETRKLDLPDSEAIRFHPRLRVTHTSEFAPAMVCILTDIRSDEFTGIHRTFLTDKARKISNAVLGRASGSAIKIDRLEGEGLGIAEGVETTIAARFLYRPMWSVISANGMRQFPVLPAVEHLEIFADHDFNGVGEAAARECLGRWENAGSEVAIVMPPRKGADIADMIAEKKVY